MRSELSPLCTLPRTPPWAYTQTCPHESCPALPASSAPPATCRPAPNVARSPRSARVLKRGNDLGCLSHQDCLCFNGRLVNSKRFSQLARVKLVVKFKAHNRTLRTDVSWSRETLSFSLKSCILSATAVYLVMVTVGPVYEIPCLTQKYSI